MNIAHVEQQEESELFKNVKEEKTLVLKKRLDNIDEMLKLIARIAS